MLSDALVLTPLHFAMTGGYRWLAWEQVKGVLPIWELCAEELEANGWVESVARRTPGLGSVSAPVRSRGQMIACLCLAMPLTRVVESPGKDFGPALLDAARRIEAELAQTGTQ